VSNGGQKAIDKLERAFNSERLRGELVELLDEEPFTRLQEWAESMQTVAEHVVTVREAIQGWIDAEDRDDKAAFKQEALDAIELLTSEWNAHPLDLDSLEDFDGEKEGD
jgi:hypothetical protein